MHITTGLLTAYGVALRIQGKPLVLHSPLKVAVWICTKAKHSDL